MNKGITRQRLFFAALLVFIGLLSVVIVRYYTNPLYSDTYKALKALYIKVRPLAVYRTGFWAWTPHTNSGISRYNKEKAYNGLTLFASTHGKKAFLISMEGQIMHEWHLPFSSVWTNPPHITVPVSEDIIGWHKVHLYPNGDLLVNYVTEEDIPYGYGLVKIDKDSRILWKYAEHVHHDLDISSDGKIYTLIYGLITEKISGIKLEPPFVDDSIVILSASGQELKRLSILKAFRNSSFSSILRVLGRKKQASLYLWDTNAVEVLDERIANKFPFLEKNQVLISMGETETIAVVDMDKESVVWAIRGPWLFQHDPDFLPSGNMLIFDNYGHYGKGGPSRVIEFDPTTMEIIWQYTGDEKERLSSRYGSSQQRLPNGNTLITESSKGRILEVTREKEIVWEFRSPIRAPHNSHLVARIHWGQRFHPDSLHFEFSNANQDRLTNSKGM